MNHIKGGDAISASKLINPLIDEFNKSGSISVGKGLVIKSVPNGVFLALQNPSVYRLGMITDAGNCTNEMGNDSTGESDYADERYFIKWCNVSNLNTDDFCTVLKITAEPTDSQLFQIVTATNLGEMVAHTHSVPVDTVVMVYSEWDQGSPPSQRYYFTAGGGSLPIPQYQYMVLQAVAQNVLGADWVRCHPLI